MFTGRIIPKSVEQGGGGVKPGQEGGKNGTRGWVKMGQGGLGIMVRGYRYKPRGVGKMARGYMYYGRGIGIIDREDRYNVHGVGIMSRRQNFLSSKFCLFCLARGVGITARRLDVMYKMFF